MKTHVLVLILIGLFFNSCNKKSLPPKDEEPGPVFYFKCDIAGFPVDMEAGVNAYYMKSSYYKDSNDVYVFKGELKQKGCSDNCGFGLTILFNDYKASPNGAMNIDSTLMFTTYQYNDVSLEPIYYIGNFVPRQSTTSPTYNWLFSDGDTWNTSTCSKTFKANKTYSASLSVSSPTFNNITHTNVYRIGNPVQTNVNVYRINPFSAFNYKFSTTNITGAAPFSYSWDFGDGYNSSESAPTHEYLLPNLYPVKLTVIDANNDTCEAYYTIPAFNGGVSDPNFSAYFTPILNPKALATVSILVNDPKGNVYTLGQVDQSKNSHFEIVSVENYKAVDSDQPFKKIKIKFNCTVYNGANLLEIKDGEAVIAIAYKN